MKRGMPGARRALAVVLAAAAAAIAISEVAQAQAVPGNALGSQTGDGAGAYTGLASSPEANLFTGVAQTSIPIEVPPGRLGLAPVLALAYSSSAGPSAYGNGWTLPLPRIHRSTRRGVPRYDDTDTYVLEMPGSMLELERIPGSRDGFRARIESGFLRIGFDQGNNFWKVIDKLGVSFQFGLAPSARTGRGPARNDTFAWLLQSIEDPAGNRIEFTYRSGGSGAASSGLPHLIRYGANARAGLSHFAEVEFTWAAIQHAAPTRVSWRDGYADALDVRLAAIDTRTHGLAARRYDFSHEEDPVTADLRLVGATLTAFAETAIDDVQLPSTVFVYAPALHEGWPVYGAPVEGEAPYEIDGGGHLRLGGGTITADTVDLNGDAIADRIDANYRPPHVSLGGNHEFRDVGTWNWPTTTAAPRSVRKADGEGNLQSNVFDLDGDGFADLVDANPVACATSTGSWCVWKGSADGFANAATSWRSPSSLLRTTQDDGAKVVIDLVDLDADGRLDLVDASLHDPDTGVRHWNVYRNTGVAFSATADRFAAPVSSLARSSQGRLLHGLFDINADSLPDLVVADPDDPDELLRWGKIPEWKVYLHDGRGLALQATSWPIDGGVGNGIGLPNFVNLHADDGTTIADLFDITGDGRPDLVRRTRALEPLYSGVTRLCTTRSSCQSPDEDESAVSRGLCCFHLLVFVNTGSSFSQPVGWSSPAHGLRADFANCPYDDSSSSCAVTAIYDFDFFDVDGDGLVDFVERFTAGRKPYTWLVHPHPASAAGGGARPNLLLAMRNGVGGETMLRYGVAAGTPETRLPFAHWVVTERELRDSVYEQAPLRTSFAYRGGAFDAVDRELRGFAVVQEVDAVGTVRVREYHQDRRRTGRLRRLTNLAPAPCVAADPEDPADPCSPWRSPLGTTEYDWPPQGPVLLQRESDVPWHDGAPVENLRRTTTYRHDAYGNVIERRITSPMAATSVTTTEFVHRVTDQAWGWPSTYLVSKPVHVLTSEVGGDSPLVERTFEYEWQSPAPASLTATSTCMEWEGSRCSRWSRRSFEYDASGNMTVARAPDGATSRTAYDAERLFAVQSVDPVGIETTSTTEPRTGRVTETVSPGDNRLRSRYDGLGRLLRTWGPGTSKLAPLRRFEYAPGSLGDSPPRVVVTDAATGPSASFFDGLGRQVASKRSSNNQGTEVSVVSGLKRYDDRGLVSAEALPFDSTNLHVGVLAEDFGDAPAWLEFAYDHAGRLSETRAPDGSVSRVDRSAPGILRTDDANRSSAEHPGSVTLEFFDGLGHRIQKDSCAAAPTSQAPFECPPGSLLRRESWVLDGLGRTTEVRTSALSTASADSVTRIERDGLGNRRLVSHSNAGTWRFVTDDNGRVIEVHKPDGTRLTTSYDASGRIRRRRGPTSRASYTYHASGGGIGKVRRVTTRTRGARVGDEFGYDERGRVATRRRRVSVRGAEPADLKTAYRYDELDRRIATEYVGWDSDGESVIHVGYDSHGREQSVWTPSFSVVNDASYDSSGRLRRIDYGNGLSDLIEYEARSNTLGATGHLRCMRTTASATADTGACSAAPGDLDALHYSDYDGTGNLLALDDLLRSAGDPLLASRRYRYDALGRLSTAQSADAVAESFSFDALGNLLRKGAVELEYADQEHPSRVTALRDESGEVTSFDYDANGRRVRDGEKSYAYDDWDRLVEVREGDEPIASYGYTDTGDRFYSRRAADGLVDFELGDGIRIVGGSLERTIVFAGRTVAVERRAGVPRAIRRGSRSARDASASATERMFLHLDHQRSVRLVTGGDGLVLERSRYAPFGERVGLFDGLDRPMHRAATRYAYTGHRDDVDAGLLFLGARHYDPVTGSFLTLDPAMQFASPYAYSAGNPVLGRDADGKVWELTAAEIVAIAVGTATFVDSIVRTGDLGHSLTAGIFAGFSVYYSTQLSTAMAKPLATSGHTWLQVTASVASDGFGAIQAVEAFEDGRYAGGVVAAGMLAASLIGIESANDPGSGSTPAEVQARHGIEDRGMIDGRRVFDVNGICATRPGCFTNTLIAARENLRVLFGGTAACVGGCEHVAGAVKGSLGKKEDVLLRCNSFGSLKCLGALQHQGLVDSLESNVAQGVPNLKVEMSGSPLLRPPAMGSVTYQVNLFDPVVWVGTAYSTPLRSDVTLGQNWWVPAPVIVHHTSMYEVPFHQALGEIAP